MYENQVSDWIRRVLGGKKYQIEPKAALMLVEFLGTDLSKISNELDKLMLILPKETIINDTHIEENIGISKDFQLKDASSLGLKMVNGLAQQIEGSFRWERRSPGTCFTINFKNQSSVSN